MSKEELENKIATLTGGRAAEELVFHSITTGASNDIEQATKLARAMITRYGMSDEFDMVALETVEQPVSGRRYFPGLLGGNRSHASTSKVIELVKDAAQEGDGRCSPNIMPKLHELAKYLYEKETITGEEFMDHSGAPRCAAGKLKQQSKTHLPKGLRQVGF